jgi:hypothetical protein
VGGIKIYFGTGGIVVSIAAFQSYILDGLDMQQEKRIKVEVRNGVTCL